MKLSRNEQGKFKEEIESLTWQLAMFTKIRDCNHKFIYSYGEDLSVTGPTGIYKRCKNCEYKKAVGYRGAKGNYWDEGHRKKIT